MSQAWDAMYGDPCKTDLEDIDLDAMQGMVREPDEEPPSRSPLSPAELISRLEQRVKLLEAELSQARLIEARVTARMEASGQRARLEAMIHAVVSGAHGCGAAALVDAAEALLAEVDRRCSERF